MVTFLRFSMVTLLIITRAMTDDNLDIAIWSCVEVNVGICCACIPTLKPLIVRILPRLLTANASSRMRHTPYGMNQLDSAVVLAQQSQSHQTYALFDKNSDVEIPNIGTVRVTTDIKQDVHDKV